MDFDLDAFRSAITKTFRMDLDDAAHITQIVAGCFFGEEEVNDEDLDKETRSLFYTLEGEGLMTFRRTEYKFEGAVRRAFFWRLTEEVLDGSVGREEPLREPSEDEEVNALYATLGDDAWNRDAVHA